MTGGTVAAGVIGSLREEARIAAPASFKLTRELLARGVCADLGTGERDAREFDRRAREVTALLRAAGVTVDTSGLGS